MPSAVVLLSGGLDSATAAALARREGWSLYALTVRYGQVHAVEVEAGRGASPPPWASSATSNSTSTSAARSAGRRSSAMA